MRSSTTRSGAGASQASTPAGPSAAISTANPSLRRRAATASAIVGSSSITRIVREAQWRRRFGHAEAMLRNACAGVPPEVWRFGAGLLPVRGGSVRIRQAGCRSVDQVDAHGVPVRGCSAPRTATSRISPASVRTWTRKWSRRKVRSTTVTATGPSGSQAEAVGPDGDEAAERRGHVVAEEVGDERVGRGCQTATAARVLLDPTVVHTHDPVGERERLLVVVGDEQDRCGRGGRRSRRSSVTRCSRSTRSSAPSGSSSMRRRGRARGRGRGRRVAARRPRARAPRVARIRRGRRGSSSSATRACAVRSRDAAASAGRTRRWPATSRCGNSAWSWNMSPNRRRCGGVVARSTSSHATVPCVGGLEPGDRAQQRALAAAARPEDADHLAVATVEVDVVDGDVVVVAGRPDRGPSDGRASELADAARRGGGRRRASRSRPSTISSTLAAIAPPKLSVAGLAEQPVDRRSGSVGGSGRTTNAVAPNSPSEIANANAPATNSARPAIGRSTARRARRRARAEHRRGFAQARVDRPQHRARRAARRTATRRAPARAARATASRAGRAGARRAR